MNNVLKYDFKYHFQLIYEKLLDFFRKKSYSIAKIGKNIKEHSVYSFDNEANKLIIEYLTQFFKIPARIISEESKERVIGDKEPKYTFVIDPVDGSANVERDINIFSFGIALLEGVKHLSVNSVIASIVGNLFSNEFYIAQRNRGAYCNKKLLHGSNKREPERFMINFELSHLKKGDFPYLMEIIPKIHQVRSLGSAITALSLVAKGALDAHIDIRNRLTIENILPPSLLILESEGLLTDLSGNNLKPAKNLKQPYNIVASGNLTIHTWILERIKERIL